MKRRVTDFYFPAKRSLPSSGDTQQHNTPSPEDHNPRPFPAYLTCPFCQTSLPSSFLDLHLSLHDSPSKNSSMADQSPSSPSPSPSPSPADPSLSPLRLLLSEGRRVRDLHLYFLLELSEEQKILPQIYFSQEFHEKYSLETFSWSAAEVKLKNFDGYLPEIGSSGVPLSRKCLLTLVTNIPPRIPCQDQREATSSGEGDGGHGRPCDGSSSSTNRDGLDPYEISILKSMIQKAFRRGLALEGAHISFQLLIHSPEEFLRRLPIILIEDGLLHWSYPILIWMMIALSKGYHPPLPLLVICLHVYIEGALGKYQDIICGIPLEETKPSLPHPHPHLASITDIELSAQRTLICSVLLRASYGGMEGDMKMLRHSVAQWATRFRLLSSSTTHLLVSQPPVSPQHHLYLHQQYFSSLTQYFHFFLPDLTQDINSCSLSAIEEFIQHSLPLLSSPTLSSHTESFLSCHLLFDSTHHLISEGIDFHCDSQMIPSLVRLLNTSPDLHEAYQKWFEKERSGTDRSPKLQLDSQQNYIKATIWLFRSSINVRRAAVWSDLIPDTDERMKNIFDHEMRVWRQEKEATLNEKAKFSGLWRILCPLVNEYSQKKLRHLRERLSSSLPN